MSYHRNGAVLLEVMCALVLLAGAGVALVRLLAASAQSVAHAAATEEAREQQARVLTAHSLMTVRELSERSGLRLLGDLTVDVTRQSPRVFRVIVSSRYSNGPPPLASLLYAVE